MRIINSQVVLHVPTGRCQLLPAFNSVLQTASWQFLPARTLSSSHKLALGTWSTKGDHHKSMFSMVWLWETMYDIINAPTGKLRISPRQVSWSTLWPEVGNWYLVYQGRASYTDVWHGLVIGDHMRLSKSSDRKVENFPIAVVVLKSVGRSWGFVLWSIKRTTIQSHTAQYGDGQLCETVHIIAWLSVIGLRLRLHFRPESWNFGH